jgi:phage/plasmid-like protein (TIGR03299 family)
MSAEVDQMFSVRESFWWKGTSEDHGQGQIISDHPTWEEARTLAGLDWDPESEPVFKPIDAAELKAAYASVLFDGELSPAEQLERMVDLASAAQPRIEGYKRVRRNDTDATLSVMTDAYSLITNGDFGEIFEAVQGQDNVKFETGGCLSGGKAVWMLSMLDEPLEIAGDASTATYPFLALMSRNDGMGGTVLRPTHVRIVCKNTFSLAEMGEAGYTVRGKNNGQFGFVHRGDWRDRIEEAKAAVGLARQQARAYQAWAAEMLAIKVTEAIEEQFISEFLPEPVGVVSDRVKQNVENARNAFRAVLASDTVDGANIRGTGYGLVNAAGEYLDHIREARTWDTRMNRTLLTPETMKGKAVKIVRTLTADQPAPKRVKAAA